jgi:hypothetical protein
MRSSTGHNVDIIENKGIIPRELRAGIGQRIYGCDTCLDVCPWNRFAKAGRQVLLAARYGLADLPLRDVLELTPERFAAVFKGTAIKRVKLVGLLRNASIVAANTGAHECLDILVRLAGHASPVVRAHAVWAVRTLGSNELGAAAGCITDKNNLAGIVSTNATVYKAAAPVYDSSTQSLNYTVAAPHYMSSGELFKGAYSLIIRSDVARCIYKFDSAPITSTIEVIDTGGETTTAVTNVSEKDGWIKLSASGFTHSTPTIRAKMTQAKATGQVTETAPAVRTPAVKAPRVAKGRSVKSSQIVKWAKLKASPKSRVTLSVTKSSRRVCFVKGSSVVASAKGTCIVTVTMRTGSKRTVKTVNFTVL